MSTTTTTTRFAARVLARSLAVALLLLIALPGTASAQDAYRYWGYYHWQDGQWAFADTGPDGFVPADGDVEGWRFAVTDESSTRLPRADGDFDLICGTAAEADPGQKRVAVVIDHGTPEDSADGAEPPAPTAACAVVAEDANGAQVLTAVTSTRVEGGLVCALDGYPATGCGEAVAGPAPAGSEEPVTLVLGGSTGADTGSDTAAEAADQSTAAASETADGGGVPVSLLLGIGAVAAVGVGAAVVARRTKTAA